MKTKFEKLIKSEYFRFILAFGIIKKVIIILLILSPYLTFSQNYYLYVASESEDTVSLLKFDKNQIEEIERISVGTFPTEIEGPHGITVDPNGKYWYLSLAHGNPFGKLIKYSTKTNKVVDETTLGLFPASMQISTITGFLYCVNFNLHGTMAPSNVSVVDPETMTEITKITTGSMPHGSRISPDGLYQYSVAMMSGELFEIDALGLKVNRVLDLENKMMKNKKMSHKMMDMDKKMDSMKMNKMKSVQNMKHSMVKPTWVIPHPNLKLAYIAGNGSNEIIEVDLENWEVSDRFKTGKGPYNLEISPNGELLIGTIKSEGKTAIWGLKDKKLLSLLKNTTSISHGIAISSDSKYAFISSEGIGGEPGIVDVISLETFKLISSVEVGKQAGGIAFWKKEI
jgi:DNA-binding beta-propeller fold protein YncE